MPDSTQKKYTKAELQKQFKNFKEAKKHFGITARGWDTLVQKLNEPSAEQLKEQVKALDKELADLRKENEALKKAAVQPGDFDEVGFWLLDRNFDRSKFDDFGIPEEATECESAADAEYKKLAQRYHPDKGGTAEQMANVNRLHEQMMALVKMNGGVGL